MSWCGSWIGLESIPERPRVESGVTNKVGLTVRTIFYELEKFGTTTTRSNVIPMGPRTNRAPTCESFAGGYKVQSGWHDKVTD